MKIAPVFFSHDICHNKKIKPTFSKCYPIQKGMECGHCSQSVSFKSFFPFWQPQPRSQKSIEECLNSNLNFEKVDSCSPNEYNDLVSSNLPMQAFVRELYSSTRSTYYSKGGITNGEFVDILKEQEIKDIDEILPYVKENSHVSFLDVVRTALEVRHDFFKYLIHELSKLDENGDFLKHGEDTMINIANTYYKKYDKQFHKYNREIKNKLEYSSVSPMIKLNLQDEIKKLPVEVQKQIEDEFDGDYEKMMRQYIAKGCLESRAPIEYSTEVDTALIHMTPRYIQKRKGDVFPIQPFSRRLRIYEMNEFLPKFENGKVYSYPFTQSCSKTMRPAETCFSDSHRALNVILRIHPKSRKTKAFEIPDFDVNKETKYKYYDDMYERKFRSEVLYPPNTKFKVLGSHKYIKNNYIFTCPTASDYYKTIIDLQEL